jgi:cyclase
VRFKMLAGALWLAACFATAAAAADAPAPFTLKPVGENVWAAISGAQGSAGANAGFIIGSDSVAVVDTFVNPEAARQLLAEIRKRTNLPIRFVINTHYHLDHVAGNNVFAEAGAMIVAHRNVRTWIRTENLKFFGAKITPEQKAMVESLGEPQIVYDEGVDLYLGTRRLSVRFMPGHTGGDSVVIVPDASVVFCGDLFWKDTLPNLIDANTRDWVSTLEKLPRREESATFVPGHGDVGKAADVANFQDYLVYLRTAVGKAQADGKSGDALVETVLPDLTKKYGAWDFFKFFSRPDILRTAEELEGHKRIPVPADTWLRMDLP